MVPSYHLLHAHLNTFSYIYGSISQYNQYVVHTHDLTNKWPQKAYNRIVTSLGRTRTCKRPNLHIDVCKNTHLQCNNHKQDSHNRTMHYSFNLAIIIIHILGHYHKHGYLFEFTSSPLNPSHLYGY